jgi:hypothetical protein
MVKVKALLIGINYFGTSSELHGCINDVSHFKEFIMSPDIGCKEEDIVVLTDLGGSTKKPTMENIIHEIGQLVSNKDADLFFFLYSGHGMNSQNHDNTEPSGFDQYIVPCDYEENGEIEDNDLREMLVDQLATHQKLIAVFDDCHSGTVLDLKYNYVIRKNDAKQFKYETNIIPAFADSIGNVILFSGCKDMETSSDAYINGQSQGAMSFAFLTAYRELKMRGGAITYLALMSKLDDILRERQYSQHPQISSGRGIDLNSLLF